ncbi:glycosyltransferase [Actinomadura meridiana]
MPDFPLSIAQVSEHASPLAEDIGSTDAGGQNIYVRELSLALAAQGHHVTVFTRRTSPHQPARVRLAPRVQVIHIPAGPARQLPKEDLAPLMGDFGDQLALHWQEEPPDLVHAHYWMSGIAALAGTRRTAIPVVTTFHALGLERIAYHPTPHQTINERERVGSERAVGQVADAIIALTPEEVDYLTGPNGIPPSKITTIPVGVNLDRFTPHGDAFPRNDRLRVVTVGRMVPRKGVDTVIGGFAQVAETFNAELLIAGGPAPDALSADPTVRRLRDRARRLEVDSRTEFLGRISHKRVPELLRSADIFVCAPHYEPFGTAALEAAACGIPVIASAVGGLKHHVHDGRTGLLIPAANPDALATALVSLLSSPRTRSNMGAAGAANADRFSWPVVTGQILGLYQSMLKHR